MIQHIHILTNPYKHSLFSTDYNLFGIQLNFSHLLSTLVVLINLKEVH